MRLGMSLSTLAVVLALLVPGSLAQIDADTSGVRKDNIAPASATVLQASHFAAKLSGFAYSGTFLPANEALDANLLPAVDQRFKAALTGNLSALGMNVVGFVDRYSATPTIENPTGFDTRFLHVYVATKPAAGASPATVHVVFRGTDLSTVSVNTDLESRQIPIADGASAMVHKAYFLSLTDKPGYMYDSATYKKDTSAYEDIKALIATALAQPDIGGGALISLTGHSLGAAEAALCAYLLKTDASGAYSNIALTTFGMPQVGNQAWRELFSQTLGTSHTRWWNNNDPIVKLPNFDVDTGIFYGHQDWFTVDTLYRIGTVAGQLRCGVPSGTFTVCDDRTSSTAPTNSQSCYINPLNTGIQQFFKDAISALDHQISSYQANLLACLTAAGGADETATAAVTLNLVVANSTAAAVPDANNVTASVAAVPRSVGARRLLRGSL